MDPLDLSLTQASEALCRGAISSKELTEAYLLRMKQFEPGIHAYLETAEESALRDAEASDRRRSELRATETVPALLGIPLAIKDILCVKGFRCTCGSHILDNYRPPFHATVVERLLAAGVVILGKTNTDEFAMGSSTENSAYGVTHNPWDVERVPGGSSGGSAAAVAARLAIAALGTDTGGSVRQPAAYCGVTGLKPSYGRVSRYGLVAFGSSLDCVGALTRSVEDAALLLGVMAGRDPMDSTSMPNPVPDYGAALKGRPDLHGTRIGVPKEYFIEGIVPEVEQAVRSAIGELQQLGATIREISLPNTGYALPVYYTIAPAEASANLARFDGVRFGPRQAAAGLWEMYDQTRGKGFGPEVKRRIMLGTYALSAGYYDAYYGQAQKVRTLIKTDFENAFRDVDLVVSPVTPTTAFRIGEKVNNPLSMYMEDLLTLPASLAGIPSLSVPCGFDSQHMPIGLQITGPFLGEEKVLHAGWCYQQSTGWHLEAPKR